VGDMAPRPRGGWQVGSRVPTRLQVEPTYVDRAPDYYTVDHVGDTFTVRHHPKADAPACCVVQVTVRDSDRAHPAGADIAALERAAKMCDARHG
jgi:hypothetical protein